MIVRSRRGEGRGPAGLLRAALAGATLIAALVIAGALPGWASRPVLPAAMVRAAAPLAAAPGPSARTNVTFEVVPAQPTGSPTSGPSPTGGPTSGPTPGPSPTGGNLPVTGSGPLPGWLLALGAVLVLGGGLLVTLVRRTRSLRA
jgi:hypothetical protein